MASLDPAQPGFFDDNAIDKELRRVFQICHGCRLCFSFCPSFPELFARVDEHIDKDHGEAEALTRPEMQKVLDLCFQCKLCYVKCPYTPPHEWDVDFPRLVIRAKAAKARREGVTMQDRFLGDPDTLGKIGTMLPSLVNWANGQPFLRVMMEKTLGVHRERNLPEFQAPRYASWHEKNAQPTNLDDAGDAARTVILYGTCVVNYNDPDVGVAATQVLERNGKRVVHVYESCCGMPSLDGGDLERARAQAAANVRLLLPYAKAGLPILVPQPSCGYMMKQEYPLLLGTDDARAVSAATLDLCEYLAKLHKAKQLDAKFSVPQGKVAYHTPCHLRAQNIGTPAADLMRLIPGTEVETIEKCSAFDGTWGMKTEYYQLSLKYAGKLNRAITDAEPARVASDCRLAGLNVEKGIGIRPSHPIQILRDGYGLPRGYAQSAGKLALAAPAPTGESKK